MAIRELAKKIKVTQSLFQKAPVYLSSNAEVYSVFTKSISQGDSYQKGIYVVDNVNNVSIKGLHFLGLPVDVNDNGFRDTGVGVVIKRGRDVLVENCTFENFAGAGAVVLSSENVIFRNCVFKGCRIGVDVYSPDTSLVSRNIIFDGCTFIGNGVNRIANLLRVYNASFVEIRNCVFYGAGISTRGNINSPDGTWGNGIFMWNVNDVVVENTRSYDNYWSGIVVGQSSKNVVVRGCYFSCSRPNGTAFNTTAAVWLEQSGCSNIVFQGNILYGGLSLGDNGGSEIVVCGNLINAIDYGVDINEQGRNVILTGNIIQRVSTSFYDESKGIYIWNKTNPDGANIVVANNLISNFVLGILINNWGGTGTSYGITIQGNRVYNCTYPFAVGGDVVLSKSQICCNSFNGYYRWYNPEYVVEYADFTGLFESFPS